MAKEKPKATITSNARILRREIFLTALLSIPIMILSVKFKKATRKRMKGYFYWAVNWAYGL
jgi:hypothetical protein